jgi:AcrR family transcriptional regulator
MSSVAPGAPSASEHADHTAAELFRHGPAATTRDKLIAAALDLFYTQGFHATGLDQIVAAVGISKQAFYRHFSGKDDLALEVIRRRDAAEKRVFFDMVRERSEEPREMLLAMFDVLDVWFNHPAYEGCLFLAACVEFPNPFDPLHKAAAEHFAEAGRSIAATAAAAGVDDPEAFSAEMVVLLQGATMRRLSNSDNGAALAAKRLAEAMLMQRLANRP